MKKFLVFIAVMLFGVTTCYATESEVNKNYVQFDVDLTFTDLQLKIYNYDTNEYIGYRLIDKNHTTYYYDKGINIRIVDVTLYSAYEPLEDIIIFDESKVIDVERKLKDVSVKFTTIFRSDSGRFEREFTDTDITIYDENFHEYATCKSDGDCEMIIKAGKYFIKDNMTGRVATEYLTRDERLAYVSRYMIEGIYSEDDLDLENVTRKGNLYYFDEPLYPKEYEINGEILDFSDRSKYFDIYSEGIFYVYSKQDEVIEDVVVDEETTGEGEETTKQDDVIDETSNEDKAKDESTSEDETTDEAAEDKITSEDEISNEETTDEVAEDKITSEDEISEENQTTEEEISIGDAFVDEILIDVPNTENSNQDIIYYKKKYYI